MTPIHPDAAVEIEGLRGEHRGVAGQAVFEEVLRLDRPGEEHIVIEIDKLLGKAGDAVKVHVDASAAERRQPFRRQIVPVVDNMDFGVVHIQPRGNMSPGDDVDRPHPRRKAIDAAEKIPEIVPLSVPVGVHVRRGAGGILILLLLPRNVIGV